MNRIHVCVLASFSAALTAQSHVVAPAANTTTDALAYEWFAGAEAPLRQQILVGASHLTAMVGRQITALELRRTAVNETYSGGSADLAVDLSTSPSAASSASNTFATNIGPDLTNVFAGTITLPPSPNTGSAGSQVAWSAANTIQIPLSTPFPYNGGTLCIDITGTPISGQQTWWMTDAAEEVVAGTAVLELGPGCGIYGGPQHQWSMVARRSLVPGGQAVFRAEGPANSLGIAFFGEALPTPFPLSMVGIPTAGCNCHIDPMQPFVALPVLFEPEVHPLLGAMATAEILVPLPAVPPVLGFQMTTQWFELTQLALSNAIRWQVASAMPTLDMALVEGNPTLSTGTVTNYLAPVVRFEYQ
ncbi:MAG: hypothetical protein JNK15_08370 [Planctomycetes bacterium]|nr:hypothetical protein [Planctomycetota bacterium]